MKNFDEWNELKKKLEEKEIDVVFKRGSIWWCSFGLNIGVEQDGKNEFHERPALVIRKFSKYSCLCVPLSSSNKNNPYYIKLDSSKYESYAIISQIRLVSTKRFLRKIETIDQKDLRLVLNALHKVIG